MSDMTPTQTRMTVAEFLALPESNQIIELLNREIVVNPPKDAHQKASVLLFSVLIQIIPNGQIRFAPAGLYFDEHNFVEPDIFRVSEGSAQCILGDDGYWPARPIWWLKSPRPALSTKIAGINSIRVFSINKRLKG